MTIYLELDIKIITDVSQGKEIRLHLSKVQSWVWGVRYRAGDNEQMNTPV